MRKWGPNQRNKLNVLWDSQIGACPECSYDAYWIVSKTCKHFDQTADENQSKIAAFWSQWRLVMLSSVELILEHGAKSFFVHLCSFAEAKIFIQRWRWLIWHQVWKSWPCCKCGFTVCKVAVAMSVAREEGWALEVISQEFHTFAVPTLVQLQAVCRSKTFARMDTDQL